MGFFDDDRSPYGSAPTPKVVFEEQFNALKRVVDDLNAAIVILRSRVAELEDWKARKEVEEL
jgi:hypothetical protein